MNARRKGSGNDGGSRRGGGFGWFVAGALVAVVIVFAVPAIRDFLTRAESSAVEHAKTLGNRITRAPAGATPGAGHFDFYQMLSHPTQILTSGESKEVQQTQQSNPVAQPGAYILQVASFRDVKDAQALKAQLALWGITADVQSVSVQGEAWHRVRVGPVKDLKTLNSVRERLAAHKLQPLLIRVGN